MSTVEETDISLINNRKPGRPKLNESQILKKSEDNRKKALDRYYQNKETCHEQSKNTQKRIRDLYKLIKDLTKEGKITFPEEYNEKIKELLLIKD